MSTSGSERSFFTRETFSPEIVSSFSPAANSVVSISAMAVDNQAVSGRPDRFLKPSTAIERRVLSAGSTVNFGRFVAMKSPPTRARSKTSIALACIHFGLREANGIIPAVNRSRSSCRSRLD